MTTVVAALSNKARRKDSHLQDKQIQVYSNLEWLDPEIDFSYLNDSTNKEGLEGLTDHFSLESELDSSDSEEFNDSDYNMEEDDRLFDKFVDQDVKFSRCRKEKSVGYFEIQNICAAEHEEEPDDSGEFENLRGSDEELKESYPKYNLKTDNKNHNLKLGLVFSSKDEAKFATESHCLRRGMQDNRKLGVNEFRSELCTTLKANVSKQQAYKAKIKAMQMIQGNMKEQFSRIRDYCLEMLRSNPGSNVTLKLIRAENEGGKPTFQRLYICLVACNEGFKVCRKVIGLDGCFLKGPQGGQFLTAVGIDANNNIFSIAYAVVENENKDSWVWFLTLLEEDISFENQYA
ncbi:hypothetical protein Sango_2678100 [Sesamum angolense]|uniref:MULE transposase domain-containing protein n=1 Tax=Sesamum angolense TaxID=2727404 RepID=A0AAE1W2I0_9LAMI|nr:hypothetical protein Sango_2678100 [Sesamum angolense]